MTRGFPPTELTSSTAIPGAMASAEPTERNGSARIQEPGNALTATLEMRIVEADLSGVTTTVSSWWIAESVGARLACASAGDENNRVSGIAVDQNEIFFNGVCRDERPQWRTAINLAMIAVAHLSGR